MISEADPQQEGLSHVWFLLCGEQYGFHLVDKQVLQIRLLSLQRSLAQLSHGACRLQYILDAGVATLF